MKRILLLTLAVLFLLASHITHAPPALAQSGDTCESGWTVVPSPAPAEGTPQLRRAAGSASNNVWAVGNLGDNTFTQRWDGTAWNIVPSPNVSGSMHELNDVAVVSETDAWAVGTTTDSSKVAHQLILHWGGVAWDIVSPITGDDVPGSLVSVSGVAADDVWTVGSSENQGIIRHWNGAAWETVPSPVDLEFLRVIAKSADEAWALGTDVDHNATILRWDGVDWDVETSFELLYAPGAPGFQTEFVTDFVVPSANAIWVVGGYSYKIPEQRRWHWNGFDWITDPASSGNSYAQTLGIAGHHEDDLWDVTPVSIVRKTELGHRNSSGWDSFSIEATPPYLTRASITSVPGGDFWIVGEDEAGQNLTVHGIFECTEPPSVPVTLLSPAQDQIVTDITPEFEWQAVANTSFYNLELTPSIYGPDSSVYEKIWGVTFSPGRFQENGEYSWRLQACNFVGCSSWSQQITWTQQAPPPSVPPELLSPPPGTTFDVDVVHLTWAAVLNTQFYQVRIRMGAADGPLRNRANKVWHTTFRQGKLEENSYYWHVRACNAGGCGPWADTFHFVIDVPTPPAPTLLSPSPKQVVNMLRPNFVWQEDDEQNHYFLQLRNNSRKGPIIQTIDVGKSESYRWREILPDGQYYWRVKACNKLDECSKWSKGRKFTIFAPAP